MNERIQELNAQAEKYAWEKVGKKYDLNWKWEDTKMEKFAQLIVQECASEIQSLLDCNNQVDEFDQGVYNGLDMAKHRIKEHFGVE